MKILSWAVLDFTVVKDDSEPSPSVQKRVENRKFYTYLLIFLTNTINALICVTLPVKSQLRFFKILAWIQSYIKTKLK